MSRFPPRQILAALDRYGVFGMEPLNAIGGRRAAFYRRAVEDTRD